MNIRLVCLSCLMGASAWPAAAGQCRLGSFAELPVTMEGLRPVVVAQINGVDVHFVADSGAFYSMISPAAATELNLPIKELLGQATGSRLGFGGPQLDVHGIGGGSTRPRVTTVQTLTLARYTIRKVDFLVGGTDVSGGFVGLLGQNLIRVADVEYDLADGVMRLIKPESCGSRPLAYWATPSQEIGVVDLDNPTPLQPSPTGSASVNGVRIRVTFDTGSPVSMLALPAAKRAGITPDSPGVEPAGAIHGVAGTNVTNLWAAPIRSFDIGGEEIKNTRLLIGDLKLLDADMLIGDDFFLAHRIYVAYGQRKLYFTYNGGAVFKLGATPIVQSAQSQPPGAGTSASAGATGSAPGAEGQSPSPPVPASTPPAPADALGQFANQPTDAAGFARRGTAYAARRDFKDALADLQRACELAPQQPDYFYELGRVEAQSGQRDQAIESLNKALTLKPNHVSALLIRAQITNSMNDLNTLDRLLPPQDGLRLQLGSLYVTSGAPAVAAHQFDLWIQSHPQDGRLPDALGLRCWALSQANQNLDQALKDCNAALRLRPDAAAFIYSRGVVQARRQLNLPSGGRDFKDALADLQRACELAPQQPDYRLELARIEWESGQHDQAIDSLNKVLTLKPDHAWALIVRGQFTHSTNDLNTADRLLRPDDRLRLQLGALYEANDLPEPAIHQLDLWIQSHPQDAMLPRALNSRCWLRAQTNQSLDQALKDCDAALSLQPGTANFLDSRALVEFRRGDLELSIRDYDAALAANSKLAGSLYGRGLAKLRKGLQPEGQADLAAATAIEPKVAQRFARMGLMP